MQRIRAIKAAGQETVVKQLVSDLSEPEALRIEAQLIAAHGTIETGGHLLNRVVPTGIGGTRRKALVLPDGASEKAQIGLDLLKQAILELAAANPSGISNADAVVTLGLQSDHNGEQRNFLSWSVLGILMREVRIRKVGRASAAKYKHVQVGQVLS